MTRDWWWPWWWSALADLAVAGTAAFVFGRASRRAVRLSAALVAAAAIVAAVLAPIVMRTPDEAMPRTPMRPTTTTPSMP